MTPETWKRVSEIFAETQKTPNPDRAAYLLKACGNDDRLRDAVEKLLALDDASADGFLNTLSFNVRGQVDSPTVWDPTFAEEIGPYKLLEAVGEGAFGTVYLAEQSEPFKRRVAVKIIKAGMDTREVLARFEVERQALAMMDHPNVAKVFDAGMTHRGRSYFVMEYVPGIPITDHCDRHRLDVNDRLTLFMQVCDAVQHAHQKGIIHRDLKPSNVLVAMKDDKSVPKVIDFGVAKATQQRLTEKTLYTGHGQLVGTPAYMSPEQADPTAQDIDTRSDIYSLGVLLYELLTGVLPFDVKTVNLAAVTEVQRMIREFDPPNPSTKLGALGIQATDIAQKRGSERAALARKLRGDLEWIILKCMEKDRTRRYATANGLSHEIQRYLHNEPILAGPPTKRYRMRKFVRRNRAAVVAVSSIAASLIGGLFGIWLMYARAESARWSESIERQRAEFNESRAALEAERANEVAHFLADILAGAGPAAARGRDTTMLREMLDTAAIQITSSEVPPAPETELALRHALGGTYYEIGNYNAAYDILQPTLQLAQSIHGRQSPEVSTALNDIGTMLCAKGHYQQAEQMYRIAIGTYGRNDANNAAVVGNLAVVMSEQGKYQEAETLQREALALRRQSPSVEPRDIALNLNQLALTLHDQGRYDETEPMFREALEIYGNAFSKNAADLAIGPKKLTSTGTRRGYGNEAEGLFKEALALRPEALGHQHPGAALTQGYKAAVLLDQGDCVEAERLLRESLATFQKLLGDEHSKVATTKASLASALRIKGELVEAGRLCRDAWAVHRRVLANEHVEVARDIHILASIAEERADHDEAERLFLEATIMRRKLLGFEHPWVAQSLNGLAAVLANKGRLDDAERFCREAAAIHTKLLNKDHPEIAADMLTLASILERLGRFDEARSRAEQALEIFRNKLPPGHWHMRATENTIAAARAGLGRFAEAETTLRAGVAALRDAPCAPPACKDDALRHLVSLYRAWNTAEPGKGYAEKADEFRKLLSEDDVRADRK